MTQRTFGLLDIGGSKLLAAVGGEGMVGPALRRPTPPDADPGVLVDLLASVVGGRRLDAIGVAMPGPLHRERAAFDNPPNLPPQWQTLELGALLERRFGCPVVAENDANCAGLAEARFGAARGAGTVVYYTVSTGIGTGVVHDGAVLHGRRDTEGGHQVLWPRHLGGPPCPCGGFGCLEALASGSGILRRFGRPAEAIDDPAVWDEIGTWLGLAVVNATALLDPDVVVFGGGVVDGAWDHLLPAMRQCVTDHLRLQAAPRLARAELGADRNLWGAMALLG